VSVQVELQGAGDAMARAIATKLAGIGAAAGTSTVNVVAGGQRGGRKNAMIAAVQAIAKRSPWYPNREAMQAIRFAARGLASGDRGTQVRALADIGEVLLASIRRNVAEQKNPDGSQFKALTAAYARRKQRKLGFTIPILRATGDLLGGLRVRVDRQ